MTVVQLRKADKSFQLPAGEQELFDRMLQAFENRRVGAKRQKVKSFKRDVAVIKDLLSFSEKAPWNWTEGDFESWCTEIGTKRKRVNTRKKGLSVNSQRHYQGAIRNFLKYVIENVRLRNEVRQLFNVDMQQICTSENCVPHVDDRELSTERPAFTHKQIEQFFDGIEAGIHEAAKFASKDLFPLCRDKAMFSTVYHNGLRASECIGLNKGSYSPNPEVPEFGDYGFLSVWGKGSNGSGPRHGTVTVDHQDHPPVMVWYMTEIRPTFLMNADPNEDALFLSERGKRIGLSTFEARFQHCLELAGLEGLGLVPHSLRHSAATHESVRGMSSEGVRRKLRHKYLATTQGYMHIDDDFTRDEVTGIIRDSLDVALKDKDESDKETGKSKERKK